MLTIKVPGISRQLALDEPISTNSPHFTWAEATKNGTRIPENETITRNIILIANELEKVRDMFGGRSITITSWYRPLAVNRAVGGASKSSHLDGHAVDIIIAGLDPRVVTKRLGESWKGGVGDSSAFTHLDLSNRRRWDYGS